MTIQHFSFSEKLGQHHVSQTPPVREAAFRSMDEELAYQAERLGKQPDREKVLHFLKCAEECLLYAERNEANIYILVEDLEGSIDLTLEGVYVHNDHLSDFLELVGAADDFSIMPSVDSHQGLPSDVDGFVTLSFWFQLAVEAEQSEE